MQGRGCRDTKLGYLCTKSSESVAPRARSLVPAPAQSLSMQLWEVTQFSHLENGFMLKLFLGRWVEDGLVGDGH